MFGISTSATTTAGGPCAVSTRAPRSPLGPLDRKSSRLEDGAEQLPQLVAVLDDEYGLTGGSGAARSGWTAVSPVWTESSTRGSTTVTVVPWPTVEVTSIRPPPR